jgi:hypothetical protein
MFLAQKEISDNRNEDAHQRENLKFDSWVRYQGITCLYFN